MVRTKERKEKQPFVSFALTFILNQPKEENDIENIS